MANEATLDRFGGKVNVVPSGCWEWTANRNNKGYGMFHVKVGDRWVKVLAHLWLYQQVFGPMALGLESDHLCRTRICVNPWHLEAVTHLENVRRGLSGQLRFAVQTACKRGHPFDEANTRWDAQGHRTCRACHNVRSRRFIDSHRDRYNEYRRKSYQRLGR